MYGWQQLVYLVATSLIISANCQFTAEQIRRGTLKARKFPNDVCGESAAIDKKIINGEPADLGAYPWMAAIGYSLNGRGPFWNCGGSLITDQYVLTAAHCLDPSSIKAKRPYEVTHVRLGDLDLDDSKPDRAQPVDAPVDTFIWHPQYDSVTKTNDIGLVKIKTKVTFSPLLNPICLPSAELHLGNFLNSSAVIAGWGRTTLGDDGYDKTALQEASVQIKDLDECRTNVTSAIPSAIIDDRVICASGISSLGNVDSCQGDSGGPLMLFHRHRNQAHMYIYGVVSYGYSCARDGYPGVYTRVSQFFPWILENLDI